MIVFGLLIVPSMAAGPINMNIHGANYTFFMVGGMEEPIKYLSMKFGENIEFDGTTQIYYNAAEESGKPIHALNLFTPMDDGLYRTAVILNDGTTYTIDETISTVPEFFGLWPTKRADITSGPNSMNYTVWYTGSWNLPLVGEGHMAIRYVYHIDTSTWHIMAGQWPYFIDVATLPNDPSYNPWLALDISGPGQLKGVISVASFAETEQREFEAVYGRDNKSIIDKLREFWDFIYGTGILVLTYLTYFVLQLPLVFVILEMGLFALSLEKKDIFKSIEQWFKYNNSLMKGTLTLIDYVVGIFTKLIPFLGK